MKKKLSKFKIGFIGSKSTTRECMKRFISDGFKVDYLITLTPAQGKKFQVAGYMDLTTFAKRNKISIYHPRTYSLKEVRDFERIKEMNLDILFVIGWQRIIPGEILNLLRIGAFGSHGSAMGLPRGRGRSPLNWSLIQGKKKFTTYLFRLTPDIDAGDIVGFQEFEINSFDTCETLHFKNRTAFNMLLKRYTVALLKKKAKLTSQSSGKPTYYPTRKPEDGAIDWNRSTKDLYDFIRAQTHPFPGAFTYIENKKVYIWKAQPFDTKLDYSNFKNGEIVEVFYNGNFVVKTKDASLLITDWEGPKNKIKIGKKFKSVDYKKTLKNIIKRYPEFVKENEKEIKLDKSTER